MLDVPQRCRVRRRRGHLAGSRDLRRSRLVPGVATVVLVASAVVGLQVSGLLAGGVPSRGPARTVARSVLLPVGSPNRRPLRTALPAIEAGLLPWQLAAPISREVVLPAPANQLLIAGGLDSAGASVPGIFALATSNGRLVLVGDLSVPTHDAAGTVIGRQALVFGGGTTGPSSTAQRFEVPGTVEPSGSLPAARADAAAATIGRTAFVVGGYDGPRLDAEVLATTDGLHYADVARLTVAVRYPAVAALDGEIFVFGGQASNGQPVRTVQAVDPRSHKVVLVGQLPVPLSGAVAVDLSGTIYVAGGASPAGSSLRPTATIYAFDLRSHRFLRVGSLPVAVSNAGAAVLGQSAWIVGGEVAGATPTAAVQVMRPNFGFGDAGSPGAGSPFFGDHLLVADRGNNRLLVLNDSGQVIWAYPSQHAPAPPGGFYFPDDAFFIRRGTAIISNQEENETIVELAYPSGRLLWSYGHPRVPGSAPGYLNNPDDAYVLKNGDITAADPMNCRVLVISPQKRVLDQIGTPGDCVHGPATLGSPNGDTPLADGDLLISEIDGSWVDEYTTTGHLVWDAQLPIGYPSDPQQIGPSTYLVADYEDPGAIIEFNRQGRVLYRYQPTSGPGVLNRPSLVELLPSGVFMLNDDYNDRMAAIDPVTGALVWQYGVTGEAGTASGLLNTPDGFDVLGPEGSSPTHPATG